MFRPSAANAAVKEAQGTILAADVGSVHTRVLLFDLVDGQYRLISRAQALTTSALPIGDVGVGLRHALDQMTLQTGRYFIDEHNNLLVKSENPLSGAKVFLATASGGRPMRVVMVGLMHDLSLESGRRALADTYAELVDVVSLNDIRTPTEQLNAILRNEPDLIFVVGGTNEGATAPIVELLRNLRFVVLSADPKPTVLYAGNESLHQTVVELLHGECALHIARNVRPAVDLEMFEPVRLELATAYSDYRAQGAGGFDELRTMGTLGVLPTGQGYANLIRYMGELPENAAGVLCVDVGSSVTTVTASVRKQLHMSVRPDLGVGHSAVSGAKTAGIAEIARWVGTNPDRTAVLDYAWNKVLRPTDVPQTLAELEMESALVREIARTAVRAARADWADYRTGELLPPMLIIGAGAALAQADNPGLSAMLLLDALQPTGIVHLKADPYGTIPALGSVAYVEPLAAVQVLESGGLLSLATAICPQGNVSSGTAMTITVQFPGGRTLKRAIPADTLGIIPLPVGQKAKVTVALRRGFSLRGKRQVTFEAEGSAVGLIADARGRPIDLPRDARKRAAMLEKWMQAAVGQG